MPRWKALADELDPQVAEFVGRLRVIVDRSGLDVAAVADRTGYSRTSWERYLDGTLLAPKGAAIALAEVAEVAGADPVRTAALWERAERAWSRAEARHDTTMDALRLSGARAAAVAVAVPGPEGGAGVGAGAGAGAGAGSGSGSGSGKGSARRMTVLLAGVLGVVVVVAAAVHLTRGGGKEAAGGTPKRPAASVGARAGLPSGARCGGASCAGKDPENMGCGRLLATTATSVTVGTALVEVRYSETCGAAWGRVTRGAAGDRVEVSTVAGGAAAVRRAAVVGTDVYTYTPMVVVKGAGDVKVCVTLGSGRVVCTA
ncbi:DUF2690 domain-containing protein [Streptomyces sp. NPDC058751]|uniref:helix-turn-helix domain-containing protein n=1 Tax=Streptomyces sp. NPDC058751 TaxID=3346623 RepID=UPI00368538B6